MDITFSLEGREKFEVQSVVGGEGKGSAYTFFTVIQKPRGVDYTNKMKIKVWGKDLSSAIKAGDYIQIVGATKAGIELYKSPDEKIFKTPMIICTPEQITLAEPPMNTVEPVGIDPNELPF